MKRPQDAWKLECLEDYVREHMTPKAFAEHTGYGVTNCYLILMGQAWKHIPRPEGFMYPWPERENLGSRGRFRRRQVEYIAVITEMREKGLSKREVAERLRVSYSTVREIIQRLVQKGLIPAEAP